jgi:hypothetical protein
LHAEFVLILRCLAALWTKAHWLSLIIKGSIEYCYRPEMKSMGRKQHLAISNWHLAFGIWPEMIIVGAELNLSQG